ncbi:hypothetical protein [Bdellovibrio bacteriovorus]|uniref:hypothetical protein n=1 Tax=Bdellovibrio TaxID=958 RepID=UPI0035A9A013
MITFFFSIILAISAYADDSVPTGCTTSRNFSAEAYRTWISKGVKHEVSAKGPQSKVIPLGQRVELQLIPKGSEFRGFVSFEISQPGTYVIVSDAYPRMNLRNLETGENLNPTDFGKIRDCGTVSKALRFQFTKTRKILLEFVSNQGSALSTLIWKL